jgi:predicted CoA-binding protein
MTIRLEQVLDKYWELANVNPEATKGSITGQLKALDSLLAELSGKTGDAARKRVDTVEVYRSQWMPEVAE